jgi:hypothetical protein
MAVAMDMYGLSILLSLISLVTLQWLAPRPKANGHEQLPPPHTEVIKP